MSKYVDIEPFINGLKNYKEVAESLLQAFESYPTADVKEVIHAYWYKAKNGNFWCSHCRSGYSQQPKPMGKPTFRYCPICGAIMDAIERREDG